MKNFAMLIPVVIVAAVIAVLGTVSVSANSDTTTATTSIQSSDYYTAQSYIDQSRTNVNTGADALSFTGVADKNTQLRIADLFNGGQLRTVDYSLSGDTLEVAEGDWPAGVSAYTATFNQSGSQLTIHEVKNGVTRTRVANAVNRTNAQLSQVATD